LRGLDSGAGEARRGADLLTDQTSAHDPIGGYVPNGMSLDAALELRKKNPNNTRSGRWRDGAARPGMLDLQKLGAATFDYGNNIRTFAFEQGVKTRTTSRDLCQPTSAVVLRRQRAVRWSALQEKLPTSRDGSTGA